MSHTDDIMGLLCCLAEAALGCNGKHHGLWWSSASAFPFVFACFTELLHLISKQNIRIWGGETFAQYCMTYLVHRLCMLFVLSCVSVVVHVFIFVNRLFVAPALPLQSCLLPSLC